MNQDKKTSLDLPSILATARQRRTPTAFSLVHEATGLCDPPADIFVVAAPAGPRRSVDERLHRPAIQRAARLGLIVVVWRCGWRFGDW